MESQVKKISYASDPKSEILGKHRILLNSQLVNYIIAGCVKNLEKFKLDIAIFILKIIIIVF